MTRDYTALTGQQLISALEQMQKDLIARYVVHGKINFAIASAGLFVDFYSEQMGPEDKTEAYEALQGFPTISLAAGRAMWAWGALLIEAQGLPNYLNATSRPQPMI